MWVEEIQQQETCKFNIKCNSKAYARPWSPLRKGVVQRTISQESPEDGDRAWYY